MREESRNRLLRRVDWRFLLPDPNLRRVLCLSQALEDPVRQVSAEVITREAAETARDCDLAVAADPGAEALSRAWSALRPLGSLYSEWRRPEGGWKGVASRLASAGFEDVRCWWVRPDPARAPTTAWIPLETPEPFEYYRTLRAPARNPFRLAARAARRVQWSLSPRRPVCAVARKPAAGSLRGETGEELAGMLLANWSRWGLGETPRRLSRILLASPGRSSGKVAALFFADGERRPRLAVKMPRTPELAAGLRREAQVLRALEARPGGVRGVPRALSCREDGTVVETAAPGVPLSAFLRRRTYGDLARRGTAWLCDLTGPLGGAPRPWATFADRALADFERSFGSVADPSLLRETAPILGGLPPLPPVCEHRDFSPWNVLVDSDENLSVLDWESAELEGLPGSDLVYFLTYLAFYFDRARPTGRWSESFRRSLDPATMTGAVTLECLTSYADRVGVPRSALRPLRLVTWLVHARSEYQRLREDGAREPGPDALRRSLFLMLWELEVRGVPGLRHLSK